jgi:hypothetical protein
MGSRVLLFKQYTGEFYFSYIRCYAYKNIADYKRDAKTVSEATKGRVQNVQKYYNIVYNIRKGSILKANF